MEMFFYILVKQEKAMIQEQPAKYARQKCWHNDLLTSLQIDLKLVPHAPLPPSWVCFKVYKHRFDLCPHVPFWTSGSESGKKSSYKYYQEKKAFTQRDCY